MKCPNIFAFLAAACLACAAKPDQLYLLGPGEASGISYVTVDVQGEPHFYICGWAGTGASKRAKMWRFNTVTRVAIDLGSLAYPYGSGTPWGASYANAINSSGWATGMIVDPQGQEHAFVWSQPNEVAHIIDDLDDDDFIPSEGKDIAESGLVVGISKKTVGPSTINGAFYCWQGWTQTKALYGIDQFYAGFTGVGANAVNPFATANDSSWIVGYGPRLRDEFLGKYATYWYRRTPGPLFEVYGDDTDETDVIGTLSSAEFDSEALDVGSGHHIVGRSEGHAFFKEPGRPIEPILGLLGKATSTNDNWVVGEAYNSTIGAYAPFKIMRDHNAHAWGILHWLNAPINGWTPLTAKAVSGSGFWIVGAATNGSETQAYILFNEHVF